MQHKKEQHENSATQEKCNIKKEQHENSIHWKQQSMKRVQDGEKAT